MTGATPTGAVPGCGLPSAGMPSATVARLPLYRRALAALAARGTLTASSDLLAAAAGITPSQVRKDLSRLGARGTRGVGYDVAVLAGSIERQLGLTEDRAVVIVGVGNLGQALAGYDGFASKGFRIAALVDADPFRVQQRVAGLEVLPLDQLAAAVARENITIGVVATPTAAAQEVCAALVAAGVTSILSFAGIDVAVASGVRLRTVDLSVELQILSFHAASRLQAPPAVADVAAGPRASRRPSLVAVS